MADSSYPSRAEIAAGQLEQLQSLLGEIFPANKFYTRKFTDAGITFDVASLADFSARFPFTTKQELVPNGGVASWSATSSCLVVNGKRAEKSASDATSKVMPASVNLRV